MKECCDAKQGNKDNRGDLAGIVMVEKVFRSWNDPLN